MIQLIKEIMKRLYFLVLGVMVLMGAAAMGQGRELKVYHGTTVLMSKAVEEMDSIKSDGVYLTLHFAGGSQSIALSEIDSIGFGETSGTGSDTTAVDTSEREYGDDHESVEQSRTDGYGERRSCYGCGDGECGGHHVPPERDDDEREPDADDGPEVCAAAGWCVADQPQRCGGEGADRL